MRDNKRQVIGITGLPGSGKTSVGKYISERLNGIFFSADAEVHRLYKNKNIIKKIIDLLGEDIVSDKTINKKKIAEICFVDKEKLSLIEGIFHPLVQKKIEKLILKTKQKNQDLILEVPLLFESGMDKLCTSIIYVKADRNIRYKRKSETIDIKDIKAREKRYIKENYKIDRCDYIIYNDKDFAITIKQIEGFIDGRYCQT